ncbi:hypothetical protein PU629_20395 [Pullulanibacillus sp. KACC 23026]|uniref:hypothetical protein n=1 Tax=Pullulanibacillus sp. KACC 23026 TaxID=3028315 RepID=UPI0023B1D7AA|nr:hypothetical protein [Pullulanibacillus sp. KACC 23026]WEG12429.1 hypothetical protein PU629_20395 [Pullulanibacillus sp. KACC 23026]
MTRKVYGFVSLLLALIMFGVLIKNFFFITGRFSFIQRTFGIVEPIGTLLTFVVMVVFIICSLRLIWRISIRKILMVILFSLIILVVIPIALILSHIGEL